MTVWWSSMVQRVLSLLPCALLICFSADASPKQD